MFPLTRSRSRNRFWGGLNFILDRLSVSPVAAYSLRKINALATKAVQVRRSQDNATLDVGFVGEDLDTQALLDFVGYENLFPASQSFVNGVSGWVVGSGASTVNNVTTAPDGTATGAQLNSDNVAINYTFQQVAAAGIKTVSLYAKQNSYRYLWLYGGISGTNYGVLFDLQTGTVVTSNTNSTPASTSNSITSAGNGWWRCSITYNTTTNVYQAFTATNKTTHTYSANNDITNPSTGGSIFIWGAQCQNSGTIGPHQITTGTAWTSLDGFVTTWYDQSGNGRNATQTTAGNQPRIVNSGALEALNGKPEIRFDGVNDYLAAASPLIGTTHSLFILFTPTIENEFGTVFGQWKSGENGRFYVIANQESAGPISAGRLNVANTTATGGNGTNGLAADVAISNTPTLITSISTTGSEQWKLFKNGTEWDSATITSVYTGVNSAIGSLNGTGSLLPFDGTVSELISFPSVLSTTDRQLLERNQGTYYSITVA